MIIILREIGQEKTVIKRPLEKLEKVPDQTSCSFEFFNAGNVIE
jgi:hypothetical protein